MVVKTPACNQQVSDMATKTLEQADTEKKGYISKQDYVKIASKFLGLDRAAAAFDAMDVKKTDTEKKGYISKQDYVKIASKFLGLDRAAAAFDAMDVKKTEKVTHDELLAPLLFYYTDTDDETHPLNYMKSHSKVCWT